MKYFSLWWVSVALGLILCFTIQESNGSIKRWINKLLNKGGHNNYNGGYNSGWGWSGSQSNYGGKGKGGGGGYNYGRRNNGGRGKGHRKSYG